MIIASMSTQSYTFTSAGSTVSEARRAMRTAWRAHCRQHGYGLWAWSEIEESINYLDITPGDAFRDDSLIVGGAG